jgi:glutamyl-tRNA reductase
MQQRRGRPIFFVDIAVPRDIDPEVGTLEDVFLYDIDDLGKIVSENKKVREKEIPKIEQIISEEKEKFIKWYENRQERAA